MNFGTRFSKPSLPKKSGHPLTTEDLQAVLKVCPDSLKAMVLLMVNAAYTPKDLSKLPAAAVTLHRDASGEIDGGLVQFPRPKMARRRPIDRAAVLWPENRPGPGRGRRARSRAGVSRPARRAGPDGCDEPTIQRPVRRRRHRAARAGLDPPTGSEPWPTELDAPTPVARVMGHRLAGMAEVYVDRVEHARIARVCDYVGARLLGPIYGPAPRPAD